MGACTSRFPMATGPSSIFTLLVLSFKRCVRTNNSSFSRLPVIVHCSHRGNTDSSHVSSNLRAHEQLFHVPDFLPLYIVAIVAMPTPFTVPHAATSHCPEGPPMHDEASSPSWWNHECLSCSMGSLLKAQHPTSCTEVYTGYMHTNNPFFCHLYTTVSMVVSHFCHLYRHANIVQERPTSWRRVSSLPL